MRRPGLHLELRQKQRLALTPGLQQSLNVLALPAVSLEELLLEIANKNPFIILSPGRIDHEADGFVSSAYDVAVQTVAARPSLAEHLAWQIGLMELDTKVSNMACRVAYDLDKNGFLPPGGVAQVAKDHGVHYKIAHEAVQALQSCEPTGVGAESLYESLVLQLIEQGLSAERVEHVLGSIGCFSGGQVEKIAPELGLSTAEAEQIVEMVRNLDPAPGRAFDAPQMIARVPELEVIEASDGGLSVALVNDPMSRIVIDKKLAAARGAIQGEYWNEAVALVQAVRYRSKTLLRVGQEILHAQHHFFGGRSETLVPLTRTLISERLSLHKSTVGRSISAKTLLWKGRIFDLAFFFPSRVSGAGNTAPSSHAAKQKIQRIVAGEMDGAVLSDAQICDTLKKAGVDISRRTVAKYRQCLNIPSSSERRRQLSKSAARRAMI